MGADRMRKVVYRAEEAAPWPFRGKRTICQWETQVPDYSPNDADRAWIAHNLGDVPMRIFDEAVLNIIDSSGATP